MVELGRAKGKNIDIYVLGAESFIFRNECGMHTSHNQQE
jgi:hypothetical protein